METKQGSLEMKTGRGEVRIGVPVQGYPEYNIYNWILVCDQILIYNQILIQIQVLSQDQIQLQISGHIYIYIQIQILSRN